MMNTTLKKTALIALCFYFPLPSMAWGLLGHRIVGEIADIYLNAKARSAIKMILGNESVAMSSNWADFIKSDTSYKYLDPWHYVNVDSNLNYAEMQAALKSDTSVNAYNRLVFLTKELKKKDLPKEKKVFYLRLLIHIAGDVHQPLHATAKGDRGGNDIKVSWFSQSTNLHSVWDTYLIEGQELSYTEYVKAINFTTAQQRQTWQNQPISKWLFDSYTISDEIRHHIKQPNQRLGYEYNFKYLKTVNEQLLKGGVHLAGLLNEIFGS